MTKNPKSEGDETIEGKKAHRGCRGGRKNGKKNKPVAIKNETEVRAACDFFDEDTDRL
jgi:hypothetical protein